MSTSSLPISIALDVFNLSHAGDHGILHWARVVENGRVLADRLGISRTLTDIFGILHDARRINEYTDRDHGIRSGALVRQLSNDGVLVLADKGVRELEFACCFHSTGRRDGPLLAQVCWDADRLDLGRVGIEPNRERLCTGAAKSSEIFDWACKRGMDCAVSNIILDEWNIRYAGGAIEVI